MKAPQEIAAEFIAIDSLKPNPRNVRKHPDSQVDGIAASIKADGFGRPLLVRKATMEIIAGHGAWLAAKRLSLDVVPCRVLDVTAAQAKRLAISDNRWAELSAWDGPLRDAELGSMTAADRALVGFGEWAPAAPLELAEIDVSFLATATFWLQVTGPLPSQPEALKTLRDALAVIPNVRVEFGSG